MATISESIQGILNSKNAIRTALRGRGVSVYDEEKLSSYAAKVAQIGGVSYLRPPGMHKVTWLESDGSLIQEDYVADGESLSSPVIAASNDNGLFEHWNNDYDDITQDMVIGAVRQGGNGNSEYATTLKIRIPESLPNKEVKLRFHLPVSATVNVNWGDGTITPHSGSGSMSASHTYPIGGDYTMRIETTAAIDIGDVAGTKHLLNDNNDLWMNWLIRELHCGSTVRKINNNALRFATSLRKVSFNGSINEIGVGAFEQCWLLEAIVLPNPDPYNPVNTMHTVSTNAFERCTGLKRVSLPGYVSTLEGGVLTLGTNAFYECVSIEEMHIPSSLTTLSSGSLKGVKPNRMRLPNTLLAIHASALEGAQFNGYDSMSIQTDYNDPYLFNETRLPDTVTITSPTPTSIQNNQFVMARNMRVLKLYGTITSIANLMIDNCAIEELHFNSPTVPTLGGDGIIGTLSPACVIYVPANKVAAYKAAWVQEAWRIKAAP